MSDQLYVEDAEKRKCPKCGITYAFENEHYVLFRNLTLLFLRKIDSGVKVRCKQCKTIIDVKK